MCQGVQLMYFDLLDLDALDKTRGEEHMLDFGSKILNAPFEDAG